MLKIDYGPIEPLLGKWAGDNGISIVGSQPPLRFTEDLCVEGVGEVKTADQSLVASSFTRKAYAKSDGSLYHHETGYFMWDSERRRLYKCSSIPRGEAYVAFSADDKYSFTALEAAKEIAQSPYLQMEVKIVSYSKLFVFHNAKNSISYREEMIMCETNGYRFEHSLSNELTRQ